ncbi:MAG: M81 family metallopeptidase [Myxococcota bacterium]
MTIRLAYARINQESNAFSPLTTDLDNFTRFHFLKGKGLARAVKPFHSEVPGFTPWGELSGFSHALRNEDVELVPIVSAWALPSGPLSAEAYQALQAHLREGLEAAGNIDGVYLALHGSMRAHGDVPEPEEGLIRTARDVIGERPLAVSYDLHGLMTPTKVELPDIVTAYRTNPHRDLPQIGARTARLLLRTVRGEIRPTKTWRTLPMAFGGGLEVDFLEPMRSIFRRMKEMEKENPRILFPSLFMVHPFTDAAPLGWSSVALTDGDEDLAARVADELADAAWSVRHVPTPTIFGPAEAIDQARRAWWARKTGCVYFTDVSDVVGAGGVGDNPNLLRELLEHASDLCAYVPIRDAAAVDALWDRIGSHASVSVGGSLTPSHGPPVSVEGKVVSRQQTRKFGRGVGVDLGSVKLVITEDAPIGLYPNFYGRFGFPLRKADIVVVKSFFHFRIFHAPWLRKQIGVRTRGTTDLNLYESVTHDGPIHPAQPVDEWRSRDRMRRAI